MRGLWEEAETPVQRHARHILTASAAARMVPSEALAGDTEDLIASMLTAGYDERAARWGNIVGAMDDGEADGAWALLAVASARPAVDLGCRSEERRVGKECVCQCGLRWSPDNQKKKT